MRTSNICLLVLTAISGLFVGLCEPCGSVYCTCDNTCNAGLLCMYHIYSAWKDCCYPSGSTCSGASEGGKCCGLTCQSGICKATVGKQCTLSEHCITPTAPSCDGTTNVCVACIPETHNCAANSECCDNAHCVSGKCTLLKNVVCKTSSDCWNGFVCDLGTERCTSCIADGVRCCASSDCSNGGTCLGGECMRLEYLSCLRDSNTRVLNAVSFTDSALTIQKCQYACFTGKGGGNGRRYKYAGVEDENECYCGNRLISEEAASNCDEHCAGNSAQICGGGWAIGVYRNNDASGLHAQRLYCARDENPGRVLASSFLSDQTSMTVEKCLNFCRFGISNNGTQYKFAGVEYAKECWCGDQLARADSSTGCTTPCTGNAGQTCGGGDALDVYVNNEYGCTWKFLYCSQDAYSRVLTGPHTTSTTMTTASCQAWCQSRGYVFAGTEANDECYCGNSIAYLKAATSTCTSPCTGNSAEYCGGGWALSLYAYTCRNDPVWSSPNCGPVWSDPINTITSTTLTQALCRSYCFGNGGNVAATSKGDTCSCFSSPVIGCDSTAQGLANPGCNQACSGASSETCGGPEHGYACFYENELALDGIAYTYQIDSAN